ncbi:MAG: BMP family ABC transporter substrate-binding protein, partial [Myxococcota bacterium]|nr:BMP family ABC transporter substrate-binding protein [Myxococcota bacterium]
MLSNLEGLIFADDQAGFLTGLIAGGVSSGLSKTVGVIGGLPIPPVKRFANGFKLGVEHACPDCSSTIIYCPFGGATESTTGLACPGTFADAVFGVGVAKYLITTVGVDVIFGVGGLTGSAGIKYASAPQGTAVVIAGRTTFSGTKTEAAAPYVVGVDSDEYFT